ncbi:hypothetical protein ACOMHN_033069 [Nucella lapillus]
MFIHCGGLKEKQRELIKKHEQIRQNSDKLNVGGGVTLWPNMNQMRLSRNEIVTLVLACLVLVLLMGLLFVQLHGETFRIMGRLTSALIAFGESHPIRNTGRQADLKVSLLAWHSDFRKLMDGVDMSLNVSPPSAGYQVYIACYVLMLLVLIYFLGDNVFSNSKLSPGRIKKWVCLLLVMAHWTAMLCVMFVAAYQLESAIIQNVLLLSEKLVSVLALYVCCQEFPSLPPPNVTEGTPFSPVYRAANRSGEPLTTASADTNPVLHATIQHHRETTSDVTEEAPISPGYTAANCSGEPPTTARVDNMHPVLHAMTQHDRATTCDVREETKSRDYTEVANRRESPTTVRAGSTEELPRETKRPEEAVTSDITGETYGSGDQTAANGRGRFPPMAREDRVPVPHTTRKGKDSDDALRRECTSRAGRQTGEFVERDLDVSTLGVVVQYWRGRCLPPAGSGVVRVLGLVGVHDMAVYLQYYLLPLLTILLTPVIRLCLALKALYTSPALQGKLT